ncbi:type II toxin-antitoxin system VapC family toxin [Microbacterium sp.]|uniref:type II toxin-antitoxin system VapC family toxin n=1 Tax=Microbacterium sp. TaxID=51671 RepID=UPI0039E27D0F
MIAVIDASALVEVLAMSPLGQRVAPHMRASGGALHLPHLADVETVSVVRGLVAGGLLTPDRGVQFLGDLRDFPAQRWPAHMLFERIWELRANVTAYDATYVALAEALGGRLITTDAKLARGVAGVAACEVVLVE